MSFLGALPSYNSKNFSTSSAPARKANSKIKPSSKVPALYTATHDTAPPPQQVITTEKTDLLFRKLQQKQESLGSHKREVDDKTETTQERRTKHLKTSSDSKGKGKERRYRDDEDEESESCTNASSMTQEDEEPEDEVDSSEDQASKGKTRRTAKRSNSSGNSRKKRRTDD